MTTRPKEPNTMLSSSSWLLYNTSSSTYCTSFSPSSPDTTTTSIATTTASTAYDGKDNDKCSYNNNENNNNEPEETLSILSSSFASCHDEMEDDEDGHDDNNNDDHYDDLEEPRQVRILMEPPSPLPPLMSSPSPTPPPLDPSQFTYRSIQLRDRDQIQKLHEEWFPVTYQSEFYDDLVRGQLAGCPLFTRLAIYNNTQSTHNDKLRSHHPYPQSQEQQQGKELKYFFDFTQEQQQKWTHNHNNKDNAEDKDHIPRNDHRDEDLASHTFGMDEETGMVVCANCDPESHGLVRNNNLNPSPPCHHQHDCEDDNEPIPYMDYNYEEHHPSYGMDDDHPIPLETTTYHHNMEADETTSNGHYGIDNQVVGGHSDDDNEEVIAGCVVGSFMPVSRLLPVVQELLITNPLRHTKLFYIMTVGTASQFRSAGLGTYLVQQCMQQVQNDPLCGALYLHVITHNHAAIRLYEKLGFDRVQEIPDYYDIQGQSYPCYLYAKYFHGNRGHHLALYQVFTKYLWSMVQPLLQVLLEHIILPSSSYHHVLDSNPHNHDDANEGGDPCL